MRIACDLKYKLRRDKLEFGQIIEGSLLVKFNIMMRINLVNMYKNQYSA